MVEFCVFWHHDRLFLCLVARAVCTPCVCIAVAIGLLGFLLGSWLVGAFSNDSFMLFGTQLWRGPMVFIIAAGVILAVCDGHTWRQLRWVWVGLVIVVSLALYQGVINPIPKRSSSGNLQFSD